MPSVPSLLNEFWSELPDDVRANGLLARRRDVPTDAVRIGYFQHVTSMAQKALKGAGFMLGDTEADVFRAELRALTGRTTRFARWADAVDGVRSKAVTNIDALVAVALLLSDSAPDPIELSAPEAAALAREALDTRHRGAAGGAQEQPSTSLERLMRADAPRLELLLATAWEHRIPPSAGRTRRGHEDTILDGVSWSSTTDIAVASAAARAAWAELVRTFEDGENADDAQLHALGLAAEAPAVTPALFGRILKEDDEPPGTPQRPLSRNIRARLSGVFDTPAKSSPAPPASLETVEATIAASALPYGLADTSSRAAIHLGGQVAMMLHYAPQSEKSRDDALSSLPAALLRVRQRWRTEAMQAMEGARRRHAASIAAFTPQRNASLDAFEDAGDATIFLTSAGSGFGRLADVERYLNDASGFMIGRLWTRLLRAGLLSVEQMGAAEMWSHVHGSVVSAVKKIKDVANWRPKERPVSGAQRLFSRAAHHPDIGAAAVFALWRRVAALPAKAHLPRDVKASLDEWRVLTIAEGESTPDTRAIKAFIREATKRMRAAEAEVRDDPAEEYPDDSDPHGSGSDDGGAR